MTGIIESNMIPMIEITPPNSNTVATAALTASSFLRKLLVIIH